MSPRVAKSRAPAGWEALATDLRTADAHVCAPSGAPGAHLRVETVGSFNEVGTHAMVAPEGKGWETSDREVTDSAVHFAVRRPGAHDGYLVFVSKKLGQRNVAQIVATPREY